MTFGGFRALLTGDSEVEELNHFLERGVPDVTVLKAAHHGARNGVTPAWLDATKPEVVVISCGRNNQHGHPHPWALRYYEAGGRKVYRTDVDGEVRVVGHRSGEYEVATGERRAMAAQPMSESETASAAAPAAPRLWVFADAPGNDHYNLNGEYAVIANGASESLEIGGWTLCDAAGACFTFPVDVYIPAGKRVVVYTGSGRNDGTRFYMNRGRAVWNNRGDVATLRNPTGRVMTSHAY